MPTLRDLAVPVTGAAEADPAGSDDALLAALRAGDGAAFAAVVDTWSPLMLRVAQRYVGDRQAAEDVVQETWLGMITGLARFEGRGTVRSWAFAILINRARSRFERDARVVPAPVSGGAEPSGPTVDPARFQGPDGEHPGHWTSTGAPRSWGQPERAVLDGEVRRVVGRALAGLPGRQRLVVELRDVEGLSAEETCAALGVSPANQRVLLHRGRAAVRAALEAYLRG
jgi:RNA polymerase sigma-70 factor (ECF subfamily)